MATERQMLESLRGLEPGLWPEVLDFIGYLRQRAAKEGAQAHTKQLTARDLLQSPIVGLWADRDDVSDSSAFARQLRQQAEHRETPHDSTRH